jgi:hypothetical protein
MALLHMDGFDSYAVTADLDFLYSYGNLTLQTNGGRFGGGCLHINGDGQYCNKPIPSLPVETWSGFAVMITDARNTDCVIWEAISASGCEGCISLNPYSGVLKLWRGEIDQPLGNTTITGYQNTWHWFEVHFKYDGSAGLIEVFIDNTSVISVTGVNTSRYSGGYSFLSGIQIGTAGASAPAGFYDDFYVLSLTGGGNITRLGDSRITTIEPTGDAGPNNGVCSTGTDHFACIDEANWSTSTFLTITNTSGQEELFTMADLSGAAPSNIWAVKVITFAEKTDAGAASLEMVVDSSGTAAVAGNAVLSTSYQAYGGIFETDPHTSAAWNQAGVNAMQCGVQVP